MSVNVTSQSSFNANHSLYDRVRPEFDKAFVSKFIDSVGISKESKVLELAAGTGKFTKQLLSNGVSRDQLIIVEPSEGMLQSFESNIPGLETHLGSSYEIPLKDSSVDCVIVAQGFHWFSDSQSLEEISRVLKPNGKLGLIWNFDTIKNNKNNPQLDIKDADLQDMTTWQTIAFEAYKYDSNVPQYRHGNWSKVFESTDLFDKTKIDSQFRYSIYPFPKDQVYNYWLSRSYITSLPNDEKDKLHATVKSLLDEAPKSSFFDDHTVKQFLGCHFFVIEKKAN